MRSLETMTAEDMISDYTFDGRMVLLVDYIPAFEKAGGTIREARTDRVGWAVLPDGKAYAIGCGFIVERRHPSGEDAPFDGRCAAPALKARGACADHDEVLAHWERQRELEASGLYPHWEEDYYA